jgi:hypothetical protein
MTTASLSKSVGIILLLLSGIIYSSHHHASYVPYEPPTHLQTNSLFN